MIIWYFWRHWINVNLLSTLISLSTSILESTGSHATPIENVTSPYHSYNGDGTSPTLCLPHWSINTIEDVETDVGDILIGQHTRFDNADSWHIWFWILCWCSQETWMGESYVTWDGFFVERSDLGFSFSIDQKECC